MTFDIYKVVASNSDVDSAMEKTLQYETPENFEVSFVDETSYWSVTISTIEDEERLRNRRARALQSTSVTELIVFE